VTPLISHPNLPKKPLGFLGTGYLAFTKNINNIASNPIHDDKGIFESGGDIDIDFIN